MNRPDPEQGNPTPGYDQANNLHFVSGSDPHVDPLQEFGKRGIRILVEMIYACPICGEEHSCAVYVTTEADDQEQAAAGIVSVIRDPKQAIELLKTYFREVHRAKGDLQTRIAERARAGQLFPFAVTHYAVIDEPDYTCDDCQDTFNTIAALRTHQGNDPVTARPVAAPTCNG